MANRTVADMTEISNLSGDYNIIIHDGNGLKKTPLKNIGIADGSGPHNAWCNCDMLLGTSTPTDAQYEEISSGRFRGLPVGGYWSINGYTFRIAAFNPFLHCGDTELTQNHVAIVVDNPMYSYHMNSENTTDGGYVGSDMRKNGLANAKSIIKQAFGSSHVLTYRAWLTNAVSSGEESGGGWFDADVELMNEQLCYGGSIFLPTSNGSTVPANYRIEKSQFPLFTYRPDMIHTRASWYWLRDVVASWGFASVSYDGHADYSGASCANGVRPFFLIG
jgi:hypothetical protein